MKENTSKSRLVFNWNGKKHGVTIDRFGYHSIRITENGKRTRRMVHRLIAEKNIPNPEGKEEVHHIDGNVANNNVWNLMWVTPKENSGYSMRLGRKAKKLTPKKAKKIMELLDKGLSQYKVAKKIGINQSCVSDIATGVSWSWLKEPREI